MRCRGQPSEATKTCGADGEEVFIWRLADLLLVHCLGRFVLCVAISTEVARFLFGITSNLHSAGAKREGWRDAEQNHCRWRPSPEIIIVLVVKAGSQLVLVPRILAPPGLAVM